MGLPVASKSPLAFVLESSIPLIATTHKHLPSSRAVQGSPSVLFCLTSSSGTSGAEIPHTLQNDGICGVVMRRGVLVHR